MTTIDHNKIDQAIEDMIVNMVDIVRKEATRIKSKMKDEELEVLGTSQFGWNPHRLARIFLIVAAERKLRPELGFETMSPIIRAMKSASKRQ